MDLHEANKRKAEKMIQGVLQTHYEVAVGDKILSVGVGRIGFSDLELVGVKPARQEREKSQIGLKNPFMVPYCIVVAEGDVPIYAAELPADMIKRADGFDDRHGEILAQGYEWLQEHKIFETLHFPTSV